MDVLAYTCAVIFRKSKSPDAPASEPEPQNTRPGSKGRPTRSRKEAEAARRRPLVVSDRKEARRRDRERASQERAKAQHALMTGDEKNMPPQHSGPERRLVRDVVDSRRNFAEFVLPVALVFILLTFALPLFNADLYMTLSTALIFMMWGGILACVVDAFILRKRLIAVLTERFGQVGSGLVGYGIMRSLQIRRWRLPRPMIKHGQPPRD